MRQQIAKGTELLGEYESVSKEVKEKLCVSTQQDLQLGVQKTLSR